MCNSEKRGRRPNLMLTPFLDQKAVLAYGPRLLPRLIVRPHRKLVEGHPRPRRREGRPPVAHQRPGDPHAGDPRPMAALPQREGLSQIRRGAFARVFPTLPSQSQFNRRARALEAEAKALSLHLARTLAEEGTVYHV